MNHLARPMNRPGPHQARQPGRLLGTLADAMDTLVHFRLAPSTSPTAGAGARHARRRDRHARTFPPGPPIARPPGSTRSSARSTSSPIVLVQPGPCRTSPTRSTCSFSAGPTPRPRPQPHDRRARARSRCSSIHPSRIGPPAVRSTLAHTIDALIHDSNPSDMDRGLLHSVDALTRTVGDGLTDHRSRAGPTAASTPSRTRSYSSADNRLAHPITNCSRQSSRRRSARSTCSCMNNRLAHPMANCSRRSTRSRTWSTRSFLNCRRVQCAKLTSRSMRSRTHDRRARP